MKIMNIYEVTVNDIAKEIRKHGAEINGTEATVDLASLVCPDDADTTSVFLSIDWQKHKIELCLIEDGCEDPVYPLLSYDKTELDLLLAFVLYLLDEKVA